MSESEQRRSLRVPFHAPARVRGKAEVLQGAVDDLSRGGLRLRLPLQAMGLGSASDLTSLSVRVQAYLGSSFMVELHYEVLGPLLTKAVRFVRLALPDDDPGVFHVGCRFDVPLSDEETVVLGVPLPAAAEPGAALPRADLPGPVTRVPVAPPRAPLPRPPVASKPPPPPAARPLAAPERTEVPDGDAIIGRRLSGRDVLRWRGFVIPSDPARTPVLVCMMDEVSRQAVRLRLRRTPATEGSDITGGDPATVGLAFSRRYGDRVGLKITDGPQHLWTGPAAIRAVDVPDGERGEIFVTLAFDRDLTVQELARLRLG